MSDIELEVHFHSQDAVSVLITSSVPSGDDEKSAELLLFCLVAARQLSNLGRQLSGQSLAEVLAAASAEDLPFLADHDSPDAPRLVGYQGAPGRVRFSAALTMEPFRFRLDHKGMGLFGKGAGSYAPNSVMALLRHLTRRHAGDARFLLALAGAAAFIGRAGQAGRVSVTSQAEVAMTGWAAAQAVAEDWPLDDGASDDDVAAGDSRDSTAEPAVSPPPASLSDDDYHEALQTIFSGGARFAAAAAHYALTEAARACADASVGGGPLGEVAGDLTAATRICLKRLAAHASHFADELTGMAGAGRREVEDAAAAVAHLPFPVSSNDELSNHYEALLDQIEKLYNLCETSGRQGAIPAILSYMDLWQSDIPKDIEATSPLPAEERAPIGAVLRACVYLTEATAALTIISRCYDSLGWEIPDDLVSSCELLNEPVSAASDHFDAWTDTIAEGEALRLPLCRAVLGTSQLGLMLFQPALLRARDDRAEGSTDVVAYLVETKDHLIDAVVALGV